MSISFAHCRFGYRGRGTVIDDLTLAFPSGSTVLLGPNGAGKSTLLGLAAGVLRPASGEVRLGELSTARKGRKGRRSEYQRLVGWLPQEVAPAPGLRLREQVAYAGWLKGMSRRDAWDGAAGALNRVDLGSMADRPARTLSGGQLRRLGIAQTLVHGSRVLLLDEPTAGLDPAQRANFADLVRSLAAEIDVIVSTHQTEDLAGSYGQVLLLDEGSVRFLGATDEFLAAADPDAPPGRTAESAYTALMNAGQRRRGREEGRGHPDHAGLNGYQEAHR